MLKALFRLLGLLLLALAHLSEQTREHLWVLQLAHLLAWDLGC